MCLEQKEIQEFCVFLPHLLNEKGHHYAYNRSVQKAVELLGWKFRAYISNCCSISDIGPEWEIIFQKQLGRWGRYVSVILRLLQYVKIFREKRSSKRIYFLEDFASLELFLISVSILFSRSHVDSFWILHRFSPSRHRYKGIIISFCLRLMRKQLRSRFREWTDSCILQKELNKATAGKIGILPIPHAPIHLHSLFTKKSTSPNDPFRLWWPGEPRDSKGIAEVQKILRLSSAPPKTCEVIAASNAALPLPSSKYVLLRRVPPILSRSSYERLLEESDGILLPYDPIAYLENTSGIFVEAIIAGKTPFVRWGSWLAKELQRHALNELIINWGHPHLLCHIWNLLQDDRIKCKLNAMQQYYVQFHSIQNFARSIQQCL